MDTREFNKRASATLGGHGWMALLAKGLGAHYSTVKRWANGELTVPEYACATVELLECIPAAMRPERFQRQARKP